MKAIITALLRARRPDLANALAWARHAVVAVVNFDERGDQYVVWAPSYREIQQALPAIKKSGFRYNPQDKTWRLPRDKLTPTVRKRLEPYVTFDPKAAERDAREALRRLQGLRFFDVVFRGDGFGIAGDVWSFKESVKNAGGLWDRTSRRYWFRFASTNTKILADVVDRIVRREAELARQRGKLDDILGELTSRPWTVVKCRLDGDSLVIWSSDRRFRDVIKQHFPDARWRPPNWVTRLQDVEAASVRRFIDAIDDIEGKAADKPDKPNKPAPKPPRKSRKSKTAPYLYSLGEGYGGDYLAPGTIIRSSDQHRKEGWPDYITVVKTTKQYVREDGLSFGVGDESGYIYTYHCREATPEERQQHQTADEKRRARRDAQKRLQELIREIQRRGTTPDPWVSPDGQRYDVVPQNLYGGGEWFIVSGARCWFIKNNGADGDNWAYNNVRTGGAGAIGRYVDDRKIADEVVQLCATLGIEPKG